MDVAAWAAVISADSGEQLGAAVALEEIPSRHRRRLPDFTRNVLRCALPLLTAAPDNPVIYAAEHGDLESTVALLSDLARNEMLSPALFALSVHNAPPGALSLCVSPASDHTAIAGGATTFAAALTEAYVRLSTDEIHQVILVLAEERMPSVYAAFDEAAPGAFLAMALRKAGEQSVNGFDVAPARAGVVAGVRALEQGARRVRFSPPSLQARAA